MTNICAWELAKPLGCEAYRALVGEQLDPNVVTEIREATNGNIAPGNERFRAEIGLKIRR
jgi:hypothetical protein